MMTQAGEPWGYYPQDSNGLAVQYALAEPCACPVVDPMQVAVCSPLVDGGCGRSECDVSPVIFGIDITKCLDGKKKTKRKPIRCVLIFVRCLRMLTAKEQGLVLIHEWVEFVILFPRRDVKPFAKTFIIENTLPTVGLLALKQPCQVVRNAPNVAINCARIRREVRCKREV